MKTVNYAKSVGTMIGLEDHSHRWTAPRKSSFRGVGGIVKTDLPCDGGMMSLFQDST